MLFIQSQKSENIRKLICSDPFYAFPVGQHSLSGDGGRIRKKWRKVQDIILDRNLETEEVKEEQDQNKTELHRL